MSITPHPAWVAFDIDGTLYDSSAVLVPAYERGIATYDSRIPVPSLAQITALVGRPNWEILATLFPLLDEHQRNELERAIMDALAQLVRTGQGALYPGCVEMLTVLRESGRQLIAVSNGRQAYLDAVFACYDFAPLFKPLRTLDSERLTAKAELLRAYMDVHAIAADDVIMVGDRTGDLRAAEAVGCSFIGCLFGYASEAELGGQRLTVRALGEIPGLL